MCQKIKTELTALLKARYPWIYLIAAEELQAEETLAAVAKTRGMAIEYWGLSRGFVDLDGEVIDGTNDPIGCLARIFATDKPTLFVLRDFDAHLDDAQVRRWVRDLAVALPRNPKVSRTVVILSTSLKLPASVEKSFAVVDWPLPDKAEIRDLLSGLFGTDLDSVLADPIDRIVEAATGLTATEIENIAAKIVARDRKLAARPLIEAKRDAIRKAGTVEFVPSEGTFDDVAGLEVLKDFLGQRRANFSEAAKAFGLGIPRGVLFVGPPGTGKSLCAKVTAGAWGLPLIRLDAGKLMGSLVGESEAKTEAAIKVCEAAAPCVVWIDEIEKALAGSGTDTSGVTTRMVGRLLTWMTEKTAACYIVATANDVSALPPELLRKGRFDEIFVVDLPHAGERAQCLAVHLAKRGRDAKAFDLGALAEASEGFSGAELEQAVKDGLQAAFADGRRALTTADVAAAIEGTTPLSVTFNERIQALRDWAKGRAKLASKPPVVEAKSRARRIDLSEGK